MGDKAAQPQAVLNFEKVEDSICRVERAKMNAKSRRPHAESPRCEHCGAPTWEFRHNLSKGIGEMLIRLYRRGGRAAVKDLFGGYSAASNFHKARYFDLIFHANADDKKEGIWTLTELGEEFIRCTIRVRRRCWTYRAEVVEREGEEILITELVPGWDWKIDYAREARPHAA